jgi:hypothetical protein
MTVMIYDVVVDVLGKGFGDSQWRSIEEVGPLLGLVNPRWTPRQISKAIRIFLEYYLLSRRTDGKYRGHPEYCITEKGLKALDAYRDCWNRKLDSDPDRINKLREEQALRRKDLASYQKRHSY